ncbi:hypothetical protein ACFYT3_25705 [Nocardia amikacinitolerans]|uniref:hypothetical protein n=1 Tax=Nocardia amikacinitolerans TaxID=756689 RepID=UPI0020A2CCAD|nr:hypothetical protein [Nocardia amikacinitolerans]MCP2289575.1 hypothetical protein [Nocardia amikacinitolerans]
MSLSPNIRKTLVTLAVSGALVTSTGLATAPALAAPEPVPTATATIADSGSAGAGSASGSAAYGRDFVQLIVCLLKGQFMGSKYPLC